MVSPHELLSTIEAAIAGPTPPTASQRIELLHALRASLPSLQSLLSYPGPKASDRAQVQSREVRLPGSHPIPLDDDDVEIALRLSDDLNLNEIECVRLLVLANTEWVLDGRDKLERYQLAAGLWYSERRDLITSLYTLLRCVVLDQGLDANLVEEIERQMEDLLKLGLRQRIITLIKEFRRDLHPGCEQYVLDFRGTAVERRAMVSRERLALTHCLVLSILVSPIGSKDIKDVFAILKDCAAEINESTFLEELQITFGLMFYVVISLISGALSTGKPSLLSSDASFRQEFHELVMEGSSSTSVEGFVGVVRLAWAIYLMLTHDQNPNPNPNPSFADTGKIFSCLELVCSQNAFQFLLERVLQTAAYKNDNEDMTFMYDGYLHKLMVWFVSHPVSRDKVKEMREKAMTSLSPYISTGSGENGIDNLGELAGMSNEPFISLLELVSEIYQKETELLHENKEIWAFVIFAGEDHTNVHTLVAFLKLLSTLASDEEGASKVNELMEGRKLRSVGWSTLFDCLTIYEERFKQSLQSSSSPMLPDFPQAEALALVAYLNVLKKVVENGNPIERKKWFPDIEPLFKLLGYENVPPYLKGALRDTIRAFIKVSPLMKDTIWSLLSLYDLPVSATPSLSSTTGQHLATTKVYDMCFELNEVEARRERYPSTISFLNLLNALIAEESDFSDNGRRFVGIFRFVYDQVFGPFPQRAYSDPSEKWELVVACLEHFLMVLRMYEIREEDLEIGSSSQDGQLPALELMKDLMSGRQAFRNIMGIVLMGVDTIIEERCSKTYGPLLEKSVNLSFQLFLLAMERDLLLADTSRPFYQPLDVILAQDQRQIVGLLEYVRYDYLLEIQHSSIKIMSLLCGRIAGLVQLLLKAGSAKFIVDDYATCLDFSFNDFHDFDVGSIPSDADSDAGAGVLILQLLLENISRPAPNITHLLLSFDVSNRVERTILQPKFHYSCLKVILDNLEKLSRPNANALLHEYSFQLLYELCLDPITSEPVMDLLSTKRYQFFSKHIENMAIAPLPRGNNNKDIRISMLHQRAWLLKLLAMELHVADTAVSAHRDACLALLSLTFGDSAISNASWNNNSSDNSRPLNRNKARELLEVVRYKSPETDTKYTQFLPSTKYEAKVEEIMRNPATTELGGVYYYSSRGDRLIHLDTFREMLIQVSREMERDLNVGAFKGSILDLVKWGWRYNKNLEEQAAQLHMLTGWSQIIEVAISRRMSLLQDHSQILFELLDASLSMTASPDCSVKMALVLTNVGLTCMAKLRDERFMCPGGADSDSVTCLDIIWSRQLPSGAHHSILFKLVLSILRSESSEPLRRRQYALALSYLQYCGSVVDPDIPTSVVSHLLSQEHDDHDTDDDNDVVILHKVGREQKELARANFSIIRKEAQSILDLVTKDATQGSEAGKAIAYSVVDALISIDHDNFFLNQIQSRGLLRSCLSNISLFSSKDSVLSLESLQRLCTVESQLSLLLRTGHNYKKHGAQILQSMGLLEHLSSCNLIGSLAKGSTRRVGPPTSERVNKQRWSILTPVLRLVSCLTSLVDSSDFLEVKNKIVREIMEFVRAHESIFIQVLREDISTADEFTMERINLSVSILSKIWPYEENGEGSFGEELFSMMRSLFNFDFGSSNFMQTSDFNVGERKIELMKFSLCFSLSCYLYFLVRKKQARLPVMEDRGREPTLETLVDHLNSVASALERAGEEKFFLLNRVQNINELSRQDVDEIIKLCMRQDVTSPFDDIRKRRYIAMKEMLRMAGNRERLLSLLLLISDSLLPIFLLHLQDDEGLDPQDVSWFCGKLHAVLERLEHLKEEKVGQDLKLFHRSVSTLKEMCIRNMAL